VIPQTDFTPKKHIFLFHIPPYGLMFSDILFLVRNREEEIIERYRVTEK